MRNSSLILRTAFPGMLFVIQQLAQSPTVINPNLNLTRAIVEGIDYEGIYILDTSIFGHGDFGRFTFTLNGTYLSRFEFQTTPDSKRIGLSGEFVICPRLLARCRTIAPMPARSTMARLAHGSLASILARPCITPASMKMTIL